MKQVGGKHNSGRYISTCPCFSFNPHLLSPPLIRLKPCEVALSLSLKRSLMSCAASLHRTRLLAKGSMWLKEIGIANKCVTVWTSL